MEKENMIKGPDHYRVLYSIDLKKDKKTALLVNGLALLIAAVMVIIAAYYVPLATVLESPEMYAPILKSVVLIFGLLLYSVLHEVTHGIFMKRFCDAKVKYGFTGLYAYAASDGFFNKRHYVVIALSPIVILGCVLLILNFLVPVSWFWIVYVIQVLNISGAAGDLYVTLKMSKMPPDILVQDAGVSMTVYTKADEPAA